MKENQVVEFLPIDSVVPYPRNPRTHPETNVAKLVASIKEFGWTTPILVDESSVILAGHGRLLAARALLLEQVPCLRIPGLSSAQKRAYRVADNRLTLDSDWDMEALKLELVEIDLDLTLTGFDQDELDDILGLNGPREGEDDAPPLEKVAVSKLGEIWALGAHRLICADACDAAEIARLLSGVTPSVMITDPPYGVDYQPEWRNVWRNAKDSKRTAKVLNDRRSDWREAWALFHGPVAYVWHGGLHASSVWESLLVCDFEVRSQIIWHKNNFAIGRGNYHWHHEPCWYAIRKGMTGVWKGDHSQTTIWQIDYQNANPENNEQTHGTQKPVECMRRPILNHTSSGQAIYDPFMGSGTTIIAAETTARVCYGCEINPLYVDMTIRRWQTFTGKEATRASDGKTFAELEKLAQ